MARDFDGSDDHIAWTPVSGDAGTLSWSVFALIRPSAISAKGLLLSNGRNGESGWRFGVSATTGRLVFTKVAVADIEGTATTAVATDTWYAVGVVVKATAVRFLRLTAGGSLATEEISNSSAIDVTPTPTTGEIGAGRDGAGSLIEVFSGRIAHIGFWGAQLTDNEFLQWATGQARLTGMKGHWPLWGVASPEPDLSGNGKHGTVTGAVAASHAPVGPYAPFVEVSSAVVAAEVVTISPSGIVSAEDWGEANYADERFTYADSALDYEGHAALIDVVLQVHPTGIASAEVFGTAEVVSAGAPTISPSGIVSEETFGTAAVSFVVQPTAIPSEEAVGTASVGLVVAPPGIPSEEAVGAPALVVQIQPAGIASAEAFGTALVGLAIAPTGIVSEEAVGTSSVKFVVAPSAIPTGQAFGTPAVSGPGTISTEGIVSGEAIGTASLVTVIVPTGIASGEVVGTPTVSLVQFLVFGIPSEEAFGTAQVVWVVQPTGVPSGEAFGTAQVVLLGPGQPGRMARLSGTHSPREGLSGTHSPREGLEGTHGPREALVGNSGLE